MAGDVEAEHLFFAGQLLLAASSPARSAAAVLLLFVGCQRDRRKPALAAAAIAPDALAGFHGLIDHGHQSVRGCRSELIHRAGFDQALDHAPVDGGEIHAFAEIVKAT